MLQIKTKQPSLVAFDFEERSKEINKELER